MMLGIVAGVVAGVLGFLPLFAALRLSLRSKSAVVATMALYGLAGVFASLVVVVVFMIVCSQVARSLVVPFGISEIAALILATSVYVIYKNGSGKKSR